MSFTPHSAPHQIVGVAALGPAHLAWPSELRGAIENAAKREGVPYIKVSARNTSKTCSDCGVVNAELKGEIEWACPSCGVVHDRDHNAALNIARAAEEKSASLAKKQVAAE